MHRYTEGVGLWNPGTGAMVEIPDATSVAIEDIDAFSGWMALSGRTRDFTGEESRQCWALSQDGQLNGPVPGNFCVVAEGLLQSTEGVYLLR